MIFGVENSKKPIKENEIDDKISKNLNRLSFRLDCSNIGDGF